MSRYKPMNSDGDRDEIYLGLATTSNGESNDAGVVNHERYNTESTLRTMSQLFPSTEGKRYQPILDDIGLKKTTEQATTQTQDMQSNSGTNRVNMSELTNTHNEQRQKYGITGNELDAVLNSSAKGRGNIVTASSVKTFQIGNKPITTKKFQSKNV